MPTKSEKRCTSPEPSPQKTRPPSGSRYSPGSAASAPGRLEPGEERDGRLDVDVAEAGRLVGHAGRVERRLEAVVLVEARAVAPEGVELGLRVGDGQEAVGGVVDDRRLPAREAEQRLDGRERGRLVLDLGDERDTPGPGRT